MRRGLAVLATVLLGSSLAGQAQQPPVTVNVPARGETVPVGTVAEDAADDPAIWRNARRPEASLIVATDKRAGLYVYGLDGKVRHFVPAGRVNNVDLIDMGAQGVIVVASDRNDITKALLQLYRLDTMREGGKLHAFSVLKNGTIEQVAITLGSRATAGLPIGQTVRSLKLQTQTEGCVVDPRSGTLYVGEEGRGIWAFNARANGPVEAKLVAAVDGAQLVADVEGLTLMPSGARGGWLIASSQGDNAYALFSLPGLKPAGRFRIAAGTLGATQETDGIAIAPGSFGPGYAGGVFVAQDGDNAPAAQNFKLVSWDDILKALPR